MQYLNSVYEKYKLKPNCHNKDALQRTFSIDREKSHDVLSALKSKALSETLSLFLNSNSY